MGVFDKLRAQIAAKVEAARPGASAQLDQAWAQGKAQGAARRTQAAKTKMAKPGGFIQDAMRLAQQARGGMPAPQTMPGQMVNPALRSITANAFDIASGKVALANAGPQALRAFAVDVKRGALSAAESGAKAIAEQYGVDYAAAKALYDAQVGTGTSKIPVRNTPWQNSAAKAVNRVSGFNLDETLARKNESPIGAASDDPTKPQTFVDKKVLFAAAAVLLLLLVR